MSYDEERDGRALRTLMLTAEIPPSRLDTDGALRHGRRSQRRWQAASTAFVATALVAVAAVPAAIGSGDRGPGPDGTASPGVVMPARCFIRRIAEPAQHIYVRVDSGDGTGRYLIGTGFDPATGTVRPVRWVDGLPEMIDVPGAGERARPRGVNSEGVVVGEALIGSSDDTFAWVFRAGSVRRLPTPEGYRAAHATGVNARGDIVGNAVADEPGDGFPGRAAGRSSVVIWPAASPDRPRLLDAPDNAAAVDIRDDGTVFGNISVGRPESRTAESRYPYRWAPDGRGRRLPVPDGYVDVSITGISGDRGFGVVTRVSSGSAVPPLGLPVVRWNLSTGEPEALPDLDGMSVVGSKTGWLLLTGKRRPPVRISPEGDVTRLPTAPDSDVLAEGVWISQDGRFVAGNAPFRGAGHHPVIWRCEA